jgi:hypothetical protein
MVASKNIGTKCPRKKGVKNETYLTEVLDSVESILRYVDNPQLDYYLRMEKKWGKVRDTGFTDWIVDRSIAIADKYGIYVAIVTAIGILTQILFINS